MAGHRLSRPALSAVECSALGARTVLLRAEGNVTKLAMAASLATFERLLARAERPDFIVDISGLSNFEPAAVSVGADYFRSFKQAGGAKVVLVSGLATARLAAFTLAFAVHLPLVAVDSFDEACQALGLEAPPPPSSAATRG